MSGKAPKRARSAGGAGVVKPGDDPGPRQKYLENSEYFMGVALLTAQRSRDPSTQVGACIVNQENKIVGIGHNDMPNGCDGQLSWKGTPESSTDKDDQCTKSDDQRKKSDHQCEQSDDQWLETKYPYVCHAELNAIMNKNSADVKGCSMYVTLFPCNECTKLIIQAGIKEVIYLSDKHHDKKEFTASRRLLDTAGIMYKQFEPKIVFDFNSINGSKTHEDTAGPVAP